MNAGVDRIFRLFSFFCLPEERMRMRKRNDSDIEFVASSFFFRGYLGTSLRLTRIQFMALSILLNLPTHAVLFLKDMVVISSFLFPLTFFLFSPV